jgi:hypothetical protein
MFTLAIGEWFMSERIAREHAHRRNIERYEGLLKSRLNDTELRFVNQRLLEERRDLAVLQLVSPRDPSQLIQSPFPDMLQ